MERLFKDNEIINKIGEILTKTNACCYLLLKHRVPCQTDILAGISADTKMLDAIVESANVEKHSLVTVDKGITYYHNNEEIIILSKNAAAILNLLVNYMLGGTRINNIKHLKEYSKISIKGLYDKYMYNIKRYFVENSSKLKSLHNDSKIIDDIIKRLKEETSVSVLYGNTRDMALGHVCLSVHNGRGGSNVIEVSDYYGKTSHLEDKPVKFVLLDSKHRAVITDDVKFEGLKMMSVYKDRKKSCLIFLNLTSIGDYTLESPEEVYKFAQLLTEFYDDEYTVYRAIELIQDILNNFQEGNNSKSKMPIFKHTKAPSITSGIKLGLYSSSKPADYEDYDITKSYMYNLVSKTGNVNLMHNREVLKNIMDFVSAAMKLNMENIERVITISYMSGVTLKIDNPFFIKDEFKREVVIGNIIQHCTGDFQERLSLGGHILTKQQGRI